MDRLIDCRISRVAVFVWGNLLFVRPGGDSNCECGVVRGGGRGCIYWCSRVKCSDTICKEGTGVGKVGTEEFMQRYSSCLPPISSDSCQWTRTPSKMYYIPFYYPIITSPFIPFTTPHSLFTPTHPPSLINQTPSQHNLQSKKHSSQFNFFLQNFNPPFPPASLYSPRCSSILSTKHFPH